MLFETCIKPGFNPEAGLFSFGGALPSRHASRRIHAFPFPKVHNCRAVSLNSSGTLGYDYDGFWAAGGAIVSAVDPTLAGTTGVDITDAGGIITSAVIDLTNRLDGAAETLLINQALAGSLGISVALDGNGGFTLTGAVTILQYEQLISTLQYTNSLLDPTRDDRVITVTVNDGASNSNEAGFGFKVLYDKHRRSTRGRFRSRWSNQSPRSSSTMRATNWPT